jgi:hypothetical protein
MRKSVSSKRPPEKLEAEDAGNARVVHFQFLASLLHFRSGWGATAQHGWQFLDAVADIRSVGFSIRLVCLSPGESQRVGEAFTPHHLPAVRCVR